MADFGFHRTEDGEPRLAQIDNESKAEALLRLLDHTIGTAENAVVPYDLGTLRTKYNGSPHIRREPKNFAVSLH